MKSLLKKIITKIISWEASLLLRRHQPVVVGVTGSVGKTSTKEVVAAVLSKKYDVRKSAKSFNSELGVPLTILGEDNAWGSLSGWSAIIWRGLWKALFSRTYPQALVLEMGVDQPGDMGRLVRWIRLDVAVVTHIGTTPVHAGAFSSAKAVAEEKMKILSAVHPDGAVVLTHDDPTVIEYKEDIKQRVFTFGMDEGATVKGGYYNITYDTYGAPLGIAAKILIGSNAFPFSQNGVIGRQFVYPALAATAVGMAFDMNMVDILSALEALKPVSGRMRLLKGTNETLIIDDTYNASPIACHEALAALGDLRVRGKKLAILGDMKELGELSKSAHRTVGKECATVLDILVTVGSEAREIALGAQEAGMMNVRQFDAGTDEALAWAKKELASGDVLLVKGSQSMRLEKVVKGLLGDQRDVKHLVRQDAEWSKR
ncbi:MAG: hypothetical protein QG633_57 [Patescibacteria group bacterium]|jgi:UDP-N-acetylmuramoyl-tripeptide--D-alanyl-D-alanine ligase|nr:hypothetical protein [Patescibacteria group bacterium]